MGTRVNQLSFVEPPAKAFQIYILNQIKTSNQLFCGIFFRTNIQEEIALIIT